MNFSNDFEVILGINDQIQKVRVSLKEGQSKQIELENGVSVNIQSFFRKSEQWGAFSEDLEGLFVCGKEGLGLNLEVLERGGKLDEELVKNVLVGMNERVKVVQCLELAVEELEHKIDKSFTVNEQLRQESNQISKKFEEINKKNEGEIENSFSALANVKKQLIQESEVKKELETTLKDLAGQNKILEGSLEKSKFDSLNFEKQEILIRDLQSKISDLEGSRLEVQNEFKKHQIFSEKVSEEKDKELKNLIDENEGLRLIIKTLQNNNFYLTELISRLESESSSKFCQIKSLVSELASLKNIESRSVQMENLAKSHQDLCLKSFESFNTSLSEINETLSSLNQEKLALLQKSADFQVASSGLENKIKSLSDKSEQDSIQLSEHKTKIQVLEQSECLNKDLKKIANSLSEISSDFSKSKDKVLTDFFSMLKTFLYTNKGLLVLNRCLEKIRKLNSEKDTEIEVLQDILIEIQKRVPYVAVANDEVDSAMAAFLNSLKAPLLVPFIREDSGIYLFGSKKVFIKLDNGQLSIRVGGGSILVEEFILMYTDSEIAKLKERKSRQSPEKNLIIGKVLEFATGDKGKRTEMSPQKAAKVIMDLTGKNKILSNRRSGSRSGSDLVLSPRKK